MKINKLLIIASSFTMLLNTSSAFAAGETNSFYNNKSEGWFWYETEPEPIPELEEVAPELPEVNSAEENKPDETVEVNVKWLRENLPKLRDAAIDEPTYDKVSRYYYAQRVMMDKASKFASVAMEVSAFETPLDESLRRPEHQMATYDSKVKAKDSRTSMLTELSETVGLFFFYSSTCNYCIKQAPILERLRENTNIEILAVSLDGRPLPNGEFPDYVTDPGTLREKLKVVVTPTIYLVKKDGSEFHNIAAGLTSSDEIVRRSIMLANKEKWITEAQYDATKDVKEILLDDSTKEVLKINQEKMYNDPTYLADKLRAKFDSKYNSSSLPKPVEGYKQ